MLVITKKVLNQLCVSVNEKATLENPNYLFSFKQQSQNTAITCILTNTSVFARYDLFDFIEGTDATLKYTGQYILTIYEQASADNLDPAKAGAIVHVEQCKVLKEPFINKEYNPTIERVIHEFS